MTESADKKAPTMEVETSVGERPSMTYSPEGGGEVSTEGRGMSVEADEFGKFAPKPTPEDEGGEPDDDDNEDPSGEGQEGDTEGDDKEPEPEVDLPEYDPENEETVKAYEGRFVKEDGTLSMEALTAEFDKLGTGKMSEGTNAFLRDRHKVDQSFIDEVIAGLVEKRTAASKALEEEFLKPVGGVGPWNAAFKWATSGGGYSEAQKARFNEAIRAGGEAAEDARDALIARHQKSNPKPQNQGRGSRRRSGPRKHLTGAQAGGGGGEVYGSKAEFQEDFQAAVKAKRDAKSPKERAEADKRIEDARAKHRRSQAAWGKQKG